MAYRREEDRDLLEDCVIAFKSADERAVKQLLSHIRPSVVRTTFNFRTDVTEVSLLHLAAFWGWKDVAVLLVAEHDCSATCKDGYDHSPLHYASFNGHLNLVMYFITELHSDPMDTNRFGETPLHLACITGQLEIVRYLIVEAHCNPSCKGATDWTPLLCTCSHSVSDEYLNVVQYLIEEAGCDPSCGNKHGSTPLHQACINNLTHIVQYLLSTGRVNPLAMNRDGRTPLFYATGKYDIIKLFQPFIDSSRDYPVHKFTKLILTGDSGAGKTTLISPAHHSLS